MTTTVQQQHNKNDVVSRELLDATTQLFLADSHQAQRHHHRTSQQDGDSAEQLQPIVELLDAIANSILSPPSVEEEYWSPGALQQVLVSLSHVQASSRGNDDDPPPLRFQQQPLLITTVWRRLEKGHAERYLSPKQCLDCLQAATVLELQESSPLYSQLCQRLTKGDALGRLSSNQLVQGLPWAAATSAASAGNYQPCEWQLVRALARRLRKQAVRRRMDAALLVRAIQAASTLLKQQHHDSQADDDNNESMEPFASWSRELQQLGYTLLSERLSRLNFWDQVQLSSVRISLQEKPCQVESDDKAPSSMRLSSRETAALFHCAGLVLHASDSQTDDNPVMVQQLCQLLERHTAWEDSSVVVSFSECRQILNALVQWRCHAAALGVEKMGHALLQKVQQSSTEIVPRPQDVNAIFRGVALLQSRRNPEPRTAASMMRPYRNLAELFFQNKESRFLASCHSDIDKLANFVWFASIARLSANATEALASSILALVGKSDDNNFMLLEEACTPKVACRILSSFTTLAMEYRKEGAELVSRMRATLFQLFEVLGEFLLSNQLDSLDISNAMVAYAKASYTLDPGIFDHLSHTLVNFLEDGDDGVSVRRVSQSLWACGRMSEWELGSQQQQLTADKDCLKSLVVPPYWSHARTMAAHLSLRAAELSTKDVAQCLWAMARLDMENVEDILSPILERAQTLIPVMMAQETANCLWALSKLQRSAYETLFLLTRRLRDQEILKSLKAVEATTILYSLGRLNIRDEYLFATLSQFILQNVQDNDSASPTAIAHVMWAHNRVHLTPPQNILDVWASKKLGLVPVSSTSSSTVPPPI